MDHDNASHPTDPGSSPDQCRDGHFEHVTHDADVLRDAVKEATQQAVDGAYGTDPRHGLLARAVADKVAAGTPLPWNFARHFGRAEPPSARPSGPGNPRAAGAETLADFIAEHQRAHQISNHPYGHVCGSACLARAIANVFLPTHNAEERADALKQAADAIQALHPGEVKNSVLFLRDRARQERERERVASVPAITPPKPGAR